MSRYENPLLVQLTREQRAAEHRLVLDPAFVHRRKILVLLAGTEEGAWIEHQSVALTQTGSPLADLQIDQCYTSALLNWCNRRKVAPLQEVLVDAGHEIVCSTERIGPCPDVWDAARGRNELAVPGSPRRAWIEYSTEHIKSTTLKSWLANGDYEIALVALVSQARGDDLVFEPLLLGPPVFLPEEGGDGEEMDFRILGYGSFFCEHRLEDIDEFSKVRDEPVPADCEPMREISEAAFKACLAAILGDTAAKDWGGEHSDYFSAHVSLAGHPHTAAFLLKGPARFRPMTLNHLGKNNDQIVRLAHVPASLLVVQHCHDIGPEVRETLRAFAVQPSSPRRYCLIDGRDSLRLLRAYGLYDRAVELTKQQKQET